MVYIEFLESTGFYFYSTSDIHSQGCTAYHVNTGTAPPLKPLTPTFNCLTSVFYPSTSFTTTLPYQFLQPVSISILPQFIIFLCCIFLLYYSEMCCILLYISIVAFTIQHYNLYENGFSFSIRSKLSLEQVLDSFYRYCILNTQNRA